MKDTDTSERAPRVAVVVPSYRVSGQILPLLARIGREVTAIYVVDDACPEKSGELVRRESLAAGNSGNSRSRAMVAFRDLELADRISDISASHASARAVVQR